jgi:hypothetical protein
MTSWAVNIQKKTKAGEQTIVQRRTMAIKKIVAEEMTIKKIVAEEMTIKKMAASKMLVEKMGKRTALIEWLTVSTLVMTSARTTVGPSTMVALLLIWMLSIRLKIQVMATAKTPMFCCKLGM